jgi:lysozyme
MTLRGIDVSNNNGDIDWPAVAASGVAFAGIKCTESTDFVDVYFPANWKGARDNGLARIAYHFARPNSGTAEQEAVFFVETFRAGGGALQGDLLALDIEDSWVKPGVDLSDWCLRWLRAVERATGIRPFCYTGGWYAQARGLLGNAGLGKYPLWWANYRDTRPDPPAGWDTITIWQHSDAMAIPGIHGNVDGDLFDGTADGLRALGLEGKVATRAQDWQTAIDVAHGAAEELKALAATPQFPLSLSPAEVEHFRQLGIQLGDVAAILTRLRDSG